MRMCVRGWAGGQLCACMLTVSSRASTNLGCDAVVCSAGAIDDLERALATQAFPVVQRWASLDGLDCADDPAIVTAAGMVDAILCELRVAPGQAPGVAGRGHVPYLLPGLSPVEEQLVGGVWSNASHHRGAIALRPPWWCCHDGSHRSSSSVPSTASSSSVSFTSSSTSR
eukprot:COSAG01_NODE_6409_length_3688_cov_101.987441_4_plen_170_part_00